MAAAATVDSSLWWDSFSLLLTELESAPLSSDLPPVLVKKLKDNHAWFLELVSLFKPPNQKSKEALNSHRVNVGPHQLIVRPQLRDAALRISSSLCLDELQSYILVNRFSEQNNVEADFPEQEFLHAILLQYYIDRQCLLKCTRQILMHALYDGVASKEGYAIRDEVLRLVSDGMESKLLSVLKTLLSSSHPEHMDVDLFTLWSEEMLIEENLLLDILFLAYYESFCTCNGEQWRKLCSLYKGIINGSFDFGKLAVSAEAMQSSYQVKAQLLLILMETLNLDNLLQMLHDEMPLRQGLFVYSVTDIQEMDAIVSSFNAFEMKEAGPLILTWAVFLCLISSLPGKQENNVLMEIDHVGYVRQAFEAASLTYFLETLQSNILNDWDGPVAGYRSVMRTFVSAFIASYEISLELDDDTLKLILEILCKIYRGEESLCVQFWDRDNFIDGPIRCLLCNLEGEFPFRIVEFVRFLSALCEGSWSAECVYKFLDKSVGISSLFEIGNDTMVDGTSQIVETHFPLHVPGVEGLIIPSKTRGHVLKVMDGNIALVRWEYTQSGVLVLLLRLAQELYVYSNEEGFITLDLLCRLVSFNTAVCFSLMNLGKSLHVQTIQLSGQMKNEMWIDAVEIICMLIRTLSLNSSGSTVMMSMGINILAKMLTCSPSDVAAVALKTNVFEVSLKESTYDVGCAIPPSSWLLSGRLAKFVALDCEQNNNCCLLTISVLEFTMQLVETGVENDVVLALVVFCLQYVFVNHEFWKFRAKCARWTVTLKVLEVMKKCIVSIPYSQKQGEVVRDIMLSDSSIHSTLFRVICTTAEVLEKLYVSRRYDSTEIEGLQLAICSALDIVFSMLSNLQMELSSSLPVFCQALLSPTTKPIPVVTAVMSLMSYFQNPAIQAAATRVLSMLFKLADYTQQYLFGNAFFSGNDKQVKDFRRSFGEILCEDSPLNEDCFVAIVELLTSAARYQPAFLVSMLAPKENTDVEPGNNSGLKPQENEASFGSLGCKKAMDALQQYIEKSDDLIKSNPRILLLVLNFLKTLWQGATQYRDILLLLRNSELFWKHISNFISLTTSNEVVALEYHNEKEILILAYRYQCQSVILEIMAYEMFLRQKLQHAESHVKQTAELSKERNGIAGSTEKSESNLVDIKGIWSSWCKSSVLGDLIKSFASCEYDNEIYLRAKVAASMFMVHVMGKLTTGDTGCLSVLLIEKIRVIFRKLRDLPSFVELTVQYSQRGYSEGEALDTLILSDLFYHLEGELEGRKIDAGPYKELSHFLLEANLIQSYGKKYDGDVFPLSNDVYVFDLTRLRGDLGFDMWDHSGWKAYRVVAETLLRCMQHANSMVMVSSSKLSALKALMKVLSVFEEDLPNKDATFGAGIFEKLIPSCIDHVSCCFHATIESLAPSLDASEEILDFLSAQAELLLHLVRFMQKTLSLPACVVVLKTSGYGLKVLSALRSSVSGVKATIKVCLALLLLSIECCSLKSPHVGVGDTELFAEVSNVSLGLLPILCKCIEATEDFILSLSSIDLILKSFSAPSTWFPVMQKYIPLKHLILKLQDKNSYASIPIILKFFLTLARVRGGAEMLLAIGLFQSLKVLLSDHDMPFLTIQNENNLLNTSDKNERPLHVWGFGLAVVTAMIHSLGDSSCTFIADSVIPYFFSEKGYLISYYLTAPDFPSDNHDRKRARSQRTKISLTDLKETEHTLMLICALVKHRDSWVKVMKEMDSQLRERSIHLLAFISRGIPHRGESHTRTVPLLCHPVLKEEFSYCTKPSFVGSRNGWFALSPLGCSSKPRLEAVSIKQSALLWKDPANENSNLDPQTYFSDTVAIQIYRISFLLLKFLCLQAEAAVNRAEEVGFVDLAHFPELPVPEILHGLQDQAVAIMTELCDKSKQLKPEVQSICLLLLQILEMALYLELCVSQICGLRPVLGHIEDFTKEIKMLFKVTEKQGFLKAPMHSLRQIISHVYPGLLETAELTF